MVARYLLDTNILSEPMRAVPAPGLLSKLRKHEGLLATASVVWHELRFGLERMPLSKKRDAIAVYLGGLRAESSLVILPYDEEAARLHAEDRARLEKAGRPQPFRDGQIASIARLHDLTVVTANVRDFSNAGALRVENWLAEERA